MSWKIIGYSIIGHFRLYQWYQFDGSSDLYLNAVCELIHQKISRPTLVGWNDMNDNIIFIMTIVCLSLIDNSSLMVFVVIQWSLFANSWCYTSVLGWIMWAWCGHLPNLISLLNTSSISKMVEPCNQFSGVDCLRCLSNEKLEVTWIRLSVWILDQTSYFPSWSFTIHFCFT